MSSKNAIPRDSGLTPRQAELADVVLALISREGMPAVSFRAVAAEAGCSLGSIQKAFPTKVDMITAAFDRLRQQAVPLPAGEPGRPTLREWLTELALRVLPLDEARASAQRQGEAFSLYATNDPSFAAALAASDEKLRGLFVMLIRRAQGEGELSEDLHPETAAWGILAILQGAAAQLSYQPRDEDEIKALIGSALGHQLGLFADDGRAGAASAPVSNRVTGAATVHSTHEPPRPHSPKVAS